MKNRMLKKVSVFIAFIFLIIILKTNVYATDEIVIEDKNMYNEIINQIDGKVEYSKDDNSKTITISEGELCKIKNLQLNNCEIKNISGIENFIYLEELNLSNNNIADITNLSPLINLSKLDIYGCAITKISSLDALTNLTELNLSKNKLEDNANNYLGLVEISHLTKLEKLDLSHNIIDNINGIEKFSNLKELNLYDNRVCKYPGLDTLINLEYLNLGENNEKSKATITDEDLAKINTLTKLKYLNFSENKTQNIVDNLSNLTNLEYLSLEANNITDVSKLSNLQNLKTLVLYNNSIIDITSISNLTNLEELVLGKNKVKDLNCLFKDNEIALNNLKKLDVSANKIDADISKSAIQKLCDMSNNKEIELNYESIVDTSSLPHYDGNIAYVTYDDFGARCDGIYDDFIAMRNAHNFANQYGYEVRATSGKTYHIYKYYEDPLTAKTNIDWKNANFIIHDEVIEEYSARTKTIFNIRNLNNDIKEFKNLDWKIGKSTKVLTQLSNELTELKDKGYIKYLVCVEDSNKKQYIRFGMNSNSGANMQDYFLIDNDGNVLNDIQWDFEQITKLQIIPINVNESYVRNGNFVNTAFYSQSETPYTRSNTGKSIYYYRNMNISNCGNMTVSNITHTTPTDELSGSYVGFFYFNNCADMILKDCSMYTRKYSLAGRSTYDLYISRVVNMRIENIESNDIDDSTRWGIIGTNYCKDFIYENCKVNRIDAHCGIYNLNVNNCEIGCQGLTLIGQGNFNMYNTKVTASTFINLRDDYGSTWNGNMNIVDCTYAYGGALSTPILFKYKVSYEEDGSVHDFGYDCKFPNVYIENLTIDFERNKNSSSIFLIHKTNVKSDETEMEEWYKPDYFIIKGYQIINNIKNAKLIKAKYRYDNLDLIYMVDPKTNLNKLQETKTEKIIVKNSDGEEITDNDIIGTGMKLVLNDKCEFTLVTYGDITGDGTIDISDLSKMKLHLIGKVDHTLKGIWIYAGDFDGDKDISINDLARLKLILIGICEI